MTVRTLFYFSIKYDEFYALVPNMNPEQIAFEIWWFHDPPYIKRRIHAWHALAEMWLNRGIPGGARLIATIPDGYFYSMGKAPSRRAFHTLSNGRTLHIGSRTHIEESAEPHVHDLLSGRATELKSYSFIVEGGLEFNKRSDARVTYLDWEVLPPGWWRDTAWRAYVANYGGYQPTINIERLEYIDSFGPHEWAVGMALGHRFYQVAVFDEIAIADCPFEGNALYWCSATTWRNTFSQSKWDALAAGAGRIIHKTYWKMHLKELLTD